MHILIIKQELMSGETHWRVMEANGGLVFGNKHQQDFSTFQLAATAVVLWMNAFVKEVTIEIRDTTTSPE